MTENQIILAIVIALVVMDQQNKSTDAAIRRALRDYERESDPSFVGPPSYLAG